MKVIGLTGGVASGKTTVANLFAALSVPIIDADVIAHQLSACHGAAWQQIVAHFGDDILLSDGNLNRRYLRDLIFSKPEERRWLEGLLHPLIRTEIKKQIDSVTAPYCLVVIPLLVESGPYPFIDRILVVDIPEKLQIERLKTRDDCSTQAAQAIIQAQIDPATRLAAAQDVIHNDGDLESLRQQVEKLHQAYL